MISKIGNPLIRLTKKKQGDSKTKIRYQRESIKIETKIINRIKKQRIEMDKFLNINNLPRLNHEETKI